MRLAKIRFRIDLVEDHNIRNLLLEILYTDLKESMEQHIMRLAHNLPAQLLARLLFGPYNIAQTLRFPCPRHQQRSWLDVHESKIRVIREGVAEYLCQFDIEGSYLDLNFSKGLTLKHKMMEEGKSQRLVKAARPSPK
jgi:hypothetical protein